MARTTAAKAAAPSSAAKGKAGATSEADAAKAADAITKQQQTAELAEAAKAAEQQAPEASKFPVVLTLTNAWPGRHDVAGTNETLAPGETRAVEFTEKGLARFTKQIAQLADLHRWTEGQGILIEQGEQDAED